jgi:hypothetical protein
VAELVGADVRVLSSISPQRGVHPAHLPHARAPTRPGKEAQPTNKLWGLPAENDISTRAWGHQANGSLDGSDRAGSSRGAQHSQIRHLLPRLKARSPEGSIVCARHACSGLAQHPEAPQVLNSQSRSQAAARTLVQPAAAAALRGSSRPRLTRAAAEQVDLASIFFFSSFRCSLKDPTP